MAFVNIGAGLAEAGKNVASTAGAWTLEAQKADAEMEKAKLVDQLAGVRQDKQNVFTSSERKDTQTFQGEQGDKTRSTQLETTKITAAAHLGAAGMTAGATIAAAREHTSAIEKQIASQEKLATAFQPGEGGTMFMVNKADGKVTPLLGEGGKPQIFRDQDEAKAQLEAVRVTSVQLGDLQRKYQTDVAPAHALLKTIEASNTLFGAEKEAAIAKQRAVIDDIAKGYEPDFNRLNSRLDNLSDALSTKGKVGVSPSASARPPLGTFAKPAAPVTGAPEPFVNGGGRYGGPR